MKNSRKPVYSERDVQATGQQAADSVARDNPAGASASDVTGRLQQSAGELAPIGPHPTDPNRNARGRYVKRNNGHLIHGVESEQRALMLVPQRQAERALILDGLGLDETTVTRPLSYAVDRLIEAHFIAQSYVEFLAASGGPITTKGRQRRAVEGWRRAADAVAKFAQMVGLERVERPAYQSTRDWLLAERERPASNEHRRINHDERTEGPDH